MSTSISTAWPGVCDVITGLANFGLTGSAARAANGIAMAATTATRANIRRESMQNSVEDETYVAEFARIPSRRTGAGTRSAGITLKYNPVPQDCNFACGA